MVVHITEGDAGLSLPAVAKYFGAGIAIMKPNHRTRRYAYVSVFDSTKKGCQTMGSWYQQR